ncbi:hypothetical protein C2845_PM07G39750 [Panicum miliaceum]|uniref:DUF1618 domain-containing protein n=1 Tax=Panicum miliaceum TaxID=4540 RepID=A0A3L6SGN4_PANMI|nr:hypothetical protein C2845_PM07G39750 [Panicum miliaceum]
MAAAAAPPQWVVLRRFPRADLAEDAGIFLALDAPPRITQLVGSPSLLARGSGVLAADPSGVLLLSESYVCAADPLAVDQPASSSYLLWDAVYKNSRRIPAQTGAAGLVVVPRDFGDCDIMLAELLLPSADSGCALRCFSVPTGPGEWTTTNFPELPPIKFPWSSAHVLAFKGKTLLDRPLAGPSGYARRKMDYEVPFSLIWNDPSYIAIGLPAERPMLAIVHPSNPHVVYFFLKQHLFGVDLKRRMVTESASTGSDEPSNSLLAWEVPSSHQDDKFKLSDHVSMCYFYEGDGTKQKKYAHMNFYSHTSSGKKLVFAELYIQGMEDDCDAADYDDWTVSLCKALPRNYQGITLFAELLYKSLLD